MSLSKCSPPLCLVWSASIEFRTCMGTRTTHAHTATCNHTHACTETPTYSGVPAVSVSPPSWIAHLLVALDLCLKQFEYVKWKTPEDMKVSSIQWWHLCCSVVHYVCFGLQTQWLWFDENIGKWTPYSSEGNATLEKSFMRDDSTVKVTANRQKQTIDLSHMLQVTGSVSDVRINAVFSKF